MPYWNETQEVVVRNKTSQAEEKANAQKRLRYDIKNFILSSPEEMTPAETAIAFCRKWQGYGQDYGIKEIEDIVLSRIWVRAER